MRAEGTFHVASFVPAELQPSPAAIEVGIPVGTAIMAKQYEGDVSGRSATVFTSAFDLAAGVGTYVAMEAFEGRIGDRTGGFAYVHSATTTGADRRNELFVIVPSSGVGELAGISGGGDMAVEPDDTHRIWFDYELG